MQAPNTPMAFIEIVCKPLCFRNVENLIIWVLADSLSQVQDILEPLEGRIQIIHELPAGLVKAATDEVDYCLPGEADILFDRVARVTGVSEKNNIESGNEYERALVG